MAGKCARRSSSGKVGTGSTPKEPHSGAVRELRRAMRRHPDFRYRLDLLDECHRLGYESGGFLFVGEVTEAMRSYARRHERKRLEAIELNALRGIYRRAKTVLALARRKTWRKKDFERAVADFGTAHDALWRTRFPGLLLMSCGITDELVRWATGQRRLPCLACTVEPELQSRCDCSDWPAGNPIDFVDEEHRHFCTVASAEALDPRSYNYEELRGLMHLLVQKLSPNAACFTKREGRPEDEEAELMERICAAYEDVFGPLHRTNGRAMALLQAVLDRFRLDHIDLSYRTKRHGDLARRSDRELIRYMEATGWDPG